MAGLSIRSLRVFDAILLSGTLSSAAQMLNTSVSAASRQLLELERDIGMALFDRTNRQLRPTAAGLRFHAEIEPILQGLNELPATVDAIKTGERQSLSVICMPRLSLGLLSAVQARFARMAPGIQVFSSVLRRHDIQRWASSRPFDIGMGLLPITHRALQTKTLAEVRAAVLLRNDHPLAGLDEIPAPMLSDTPTIGYHAGLMARGQVDDIFRAADTIPHFVTETSSTLLACQLAGDGIGSTIIDYVAGRPFLADPRMRLVPLAPETWWRLGTFAPRMDKTKSRLLAPFRQAIIDTLDRFSEQSGPGFMKLHR